MNGRLIELMRLEPDQVGPHREHFARLALARVAVDRRLPLRVGLWVDERQQDWIDHVERVPPRPLELRLVKRRRLVRLRAGIRRQ